MLTCLASGQRELDSDSPHVLLGDLNRDVFILQFYSLK